MAAATATPTTPKTLFKVPVKNLIENYNKLSEDDKKIVGQYIIVEILEFSDKKIDKILGRSMSVSEYLDEEIKKVVVNSNKDTISIERMVEEVKTHINKVANTDSKIQIAIIKPLSPIADNDDNMYCYQAMLQYQTEQATKNSVRIIQKPTNRFIDFAESALGLAISTGWRLIPLVLISSYVYKHIYYY
jgi:hypothetical protein